MTTLKLIYFDIHGGRGEPPRLALRMAGIPFEDERVPFAQWRSLKPTLPFQAMPVLEVDGRRITQSNTINRYVGKLTDLYPSDPWQAALCDEVMDVVEDIGQRISATFTMTDEEKKQVREALAKAPIPMFLRGLDALLAAHGGTFFADDRLTVADLKAFLWIGHLLSGKLEHVPTNVVIENAPLLVPYYESIRDHPKVAPHFHGG